MTVVAGSRDGTLMRWLFVNAVWSAWLSIPLLLGGCRSETPLPPDSSEDRPTIRFLLTFDDGPSIRQPLNPTLQILGQLATNDLQPGIKAIFFVQTGHPRGGGTPQGHEMMRRIAAEGHLLGLHSTSPRGHIDHTQVPVSELNRSLKEAIELLRSISGENPMFVRPPFGAYTVATRTVYAEQGLHMLMADIRARDGVIYGYNGSMSRRIHIRHELARLLRDVELGRRLEDPVDVVLNFHDVNPYTARHMTEYLHILVEEARRVGFRIPLRPFLDRRETITDTAICHAIPAPPGAWVQAGVKDPPLASPMAGNRTPVMNGVP